MSERITHLLIALRWPLLAVAAVLAVVTGLPAERLDLQRWIGSRYAAYFPAGRLDFDRSIENMFAADDPLLRPYRKLKETFGGNEIVMAVYTDEDLLNPDGTGIERLAMVGAQLEKVQGVRDVLSLADVNRALERVERVGNWFGPAPTGPGIVDVDNRLANQFRALFESYTHGSDGKTVALLCMLEPEKETLVPRRQTIDALRRIVRDLPEGLPAGMIAGEPVMVVDGFRYVEEDGRRLGWVSTILLAATIIVCFRSLRWVLIPVAVVQLTLLLTRATLVWSRLQLSMVSSMLTAIVTVVGVATVVHLIVRFREARTSGLTPRESLVQAGTLLAAPIFWACATDAVGFGALWWAEVGPVQDFGTMMVIGSLLVLVGVALLVPGMALLGRLDADPRRAWGEGRLDGELHRLVNWVQRKPWLLAASIVLLVVVAVTGVSRLEVETDFTKNFRADSSIVRAYQFVESHLGGAGVWDVIVPAPERLDEQYLTMVRRLEQQLRAISIPATTKPGLTKVISLADAIEAAKANRLLRRMPPEFRAKGMNAAMPTFVAALRSPEPDEAGRYYMRIMLRARERQPAAQKQWLIAEVTRVVDAELERADWQQLLATLPGKPGAEQPGAEVTGFFVLLTNLIESMVRDQWVTFGVASIGIALMMLIAFRSPVLALIALVPNALPILMVLGLMGWLGLKINMGAAMIAAVSMGLSVDSSIHYITSFRRARGAGKTVHQALADVQQSVGRAMFFSTLALIVGFTVLCTSDFVPTIYFGMLVSLSMLGGMFGNLLVLPLLLSLVTREKPATKDEEKNQTAAPKVPQEPVER
jgi:hypothetical protein